MKLTDASERDALKGMLQSLEHVLDTVDRVSDAAGQLVSAQKSGKRLAPATLQHYETQLEALSQERTGLRKAGVEVGRASGPSASTAWRPSAR